MLYFETLFIVVLSASFRGRGLKGVAVQLPAGFSGYVVKEEKKAITDEEV